MNRLLDVVAERLQRPSKHRKIDRRECIHWHQPKADSLLEEDARLEPGGPLLGLATRRIAPGRRSEKLVDAGQEAVCGGVDSHARCLLEFKVRNMQELLQPEAACEDALGSAFARVVLDAGGGEDTEEKV